MATFTRQFLSGSSNGRPIPVVATGSVGTTLHTAHASAIDEVYLWVSNLTGAPVNLTIGWGGDASDAVLACKTVSIPANSPPIPIMTGQVLTNSNVVTAYAGSANALNIVGYVNRIS